MRDWFQDPTAYDLSLLNNRDNFNEKKDIFLIIPHNEIIVGTVSISPSGSSGIVWKFTLNLYKALLFLNLWKVGLKMVKKQSEFELGWMGREISKIEKKVWMDWNGPFGERRF